MPRPSVAFPVEIEQENSHFASGVNHRGEIRGFMLSGRHVGITFDTVNDGVLAELEAFAGPGMSRVFVDTGAFSEVAFDAAAGRLVVVKPIADDEWHARFELGRKIAAWYGQRAYIVAPDLVGDQKATIARLARWAPEVASIAALRAQIIVPVQKGELPMSEMFRQCCAILGLRTAPIAGIPMKKDATSLEDLAELVDSMPWFDCRFHLLGIGPKSPKFADVIRCIKSRRPNAVITSDSVITRSMVGRGGKKAKLAGKEKARPYTRYQDEARAQGMTDATEIKAYGLMRQGDDERAEQLDRAHADGWYDDELYDSLEDALAHRAAGYPEPVREVATAPVPARGQLSLSFAVA